MYLETVSIENFKALERIRIKFSPTANVIVGPNAVGKTTILEAIRLTKAVLAPRTPDEPQQTLIGLGAISPHLPQQINLATIARDVTQPINIICKFVLSDNEVARIDTISAQIVNSLVAARLGNNAANPIALTQFLSSPLGQTAQQQEKQRFDAAWPTLKAAKTCTLHLRVDQQVGFVGVDQMSQVIFAALENSLPPNVALFSYFPADRALPIGEVAIQVGGADVAQQLTAHNSQPQTKYHRLKSTIVNSYLMNPASPNLIIEQFKTIFTKLLKDKDIVGLEINQFGLISIRIKEIASGRTFDIDSMSSGEKGLLLTFLLIARTVSEGGIILLDEPELHLNPAVCKTLLPFLIDNYALKQKLQVLVCSHSPEILGSAFEEDHCSLFHLQSPKVISEILPEDRREVFDALKRLGTTTSDVLFSEGTIFVEGEHDADLLDAGFGRLLSHYKVVELGGRNSVEKEIKTLQSAEEKGEVDTLKCFIFDMDKSITTLKTTKLVKVLQWKRRCFENYLIDEKIIYEILRDGGISHKQIGNRGEVLEIFRQLALDQLRDEVALEIYEEGRFQELGVKPKDLLGKSYVEKAQLLFDKIEVVRTQLLPLDRAGWCASFEAACESRYQEMLPNWEADWLSLCDGKRFFKDIQVRYEIRIAPIAFKRRIIEKMEAEQSDGWVILEKLIEDALKV